MAKLETKFQKYPSKLEVDQWVDSLWRQVPSHQLAAERMVRNGFTSSLGLNHTTGFQYVRFHATGFDDYYGYWQPCLSGPAPLLVHVPGYGSEMSVHPELVAQGFNVLHISPLGYSTPDGFDEGKRRDGEWPVLPLTILSGAEKGYREWLMNCILAVNWAMTLPQVLPDRVTFFGTSQGGGGAILLASLFSNRGVRCVAADLPFLTNFPLADHRGAYRITSQSLDRLTSRAAGWRSLGLIDTLSHAHRLNIPVLLTQGGNDDVCPPETIQSLYDRLPSTRSICYLDGVGHRYTTEFVTLASAWFRLYA